MNWFKGVGLTSACSRGLQLLLESCNCLFSSGGGCQLIPHQIWTEKVKVLESDFPLSCVLPDLCSDLHSNYVCIFNIYVCNYFLFWNSNITIKNKISWHLKIHMHSCHVLELKNNQKMHSQRRFFFPPLIMTAKEREWIWKGNSI